MRPKGKNKGKTHKNNKSPKYKSKTHKSHKPRKLQNPNLTQDIKQQPQLDYKGTIDPEPFTNSERTSGGIIKK